MSVIRYARPGEERLIAELGASTYEAHFGELWSPAGLQRYLAAQFEEGRLRRELEEGDAVRYVVAEQSGELVGFAKVLRDRPVTGVAGERGMLVERVYVRAGMTGRGIGGVLLETALELGRHLAEPCAWLDVLKLNTGAIRRYERAGFGRRAETTIHTDRGPLEMWVMTRSLADES